MKSKSIIIILLMIFTFFGLKILTSDYYQTWNAQKDQSAFYNIETLKEQQCPKTAYLSFDDGPSNITPQVLETLEKYNIKATFFVVGTSITKEREALIKSMFDSGHVIGVHTFTHDCNKIYCSVDNYLEDFYMTYNKIYEITGTKPTIFRFPCGSVNSYNKCIYDDLVTEMEHRGFTYHDWNVSAEDSYGSPTEYSILTNLSRFEKYNQPVILIHDSSINSLSANLLPKIIDMIQEAGYEFDTLDNRKPCQFK